MIELKGISYQSEGYHGVAQLLDSSFPPEERYPMERIMDLCRNPNIRLLGIWDGSEFCGFTLISVRRNTVYIFYLAIEEGKRSKGYGSKTIGLLERQYPGKGLVLNVEESDRDAPNYEQRIRRSSFYYRNGFKRMSIQMIDDSGVYDILSTSDRLDREEFMDIVTELGFDAYHVYLSE